MVKISNNYLSFPFFIIAVVSALKGLQEKIRNLELERADAEDNLKKLATESRHYKDVLQKELTARESTQGVIAKQNQRKLQHCGSEGILTHNENLNSPLVYFLNT